MEKAADIGEQATLATTDFPAPLADAIARLDHLLAHVNGPVAVLVAESVDGLVLSEQRRDAASRLHKLIEPDPTASRNSECLAAVALAPLQAPAEGERLAQRWLLEAADTVGVAVSVRSDTGDSLLAAALSAFVQARDFNIEGVIVCPDHERSWTLGASPRPVISGGHTGERQPF